LAALDAVEAGDGLVDAVTGATLDLDPALSGKLAAFEKQQLLGASAAGKRAIRLEFVPSAERAALDSPADRALATSQLAVLGATIPPDEIAPELSYSAASIALFRYLKVRREEAGLPAQRLPDDPTSLLGNSSRATAEQIGTYLHRKLFAGDGTCALSDTGALLALHRKEGTLRWLAFRWPKLVFAGKTGSSPHDDSAVAALALCLDARPVVLVAALRPIEGALPTGLRGSVLLRGMDAYLKELSRLQRRPTAALLPAWTQPPDPSIPVEMNP